MSTTVAEVNVLTAEVRTLMVGSRQVTLSVYRQLDHVDARHVEPFGRVNLRSQDGPWDSAWGPWHIVGTDERDGTLVRSTIDIDNYSRATTDERYAIRAWASALPLIVLAGLR